MKVEEKIIEALIKDGYTEKDALMILSKYLEDNAKLYLECIETLTEPERKYH